MIYTRFGSPVEIISVDTKAGTVRIKFIDDGFVDDRCINELKADKGIDEIIEAIQECN